MSPDAEPTSSELLLAAAVEEFEAAARRGEAPELEAFCARYPQVREPLRQVLALGTQLAALGRPDPSAVPEKLGPYRVLEELGRGGMAPVFRARDERLARDVALKVLPPQTQARPGRRERFLREARILARISHPHVVPIYDVGEDGPWCYLAMELLPGSLQDQVSTASAPLEARRVARWVLEAAEGLRHAHEMGVLHRDVKPANLLLDAEGRVRVADFGLAALEDAGRLTQAGQGMGTPGFAAPEQIRGEPLDARCDVYGLGATLRALLGSGQVPPALLELSERATAADRARRHPDLAAFAADLEAWLQGRGARGRRAAVAGAALAGLLLVLGLAWLQPGPPALQERPQGIRVSVSSEPVSMARESGAERGVQIWQELRALLERLRASRCSPAPGGPRRPGALDLLLDPAGSVAAIFCAAAAPEGGRRR